VNPAQQPAHIRPAVPADLENILALLAEVGLPAAGVRDHLPHFLVLEIEGELAGTVGLELYGRRALLRSLAVSPRRQGTGLGRRLCRALLDRAESLRLEEIVLLTETAAIFFEKHGFRAVSREEVSPALRNSVEFNSACPVSAICMRLRLGAAPSGAPGS
jgi:amino-acid N-acetyltransferase